MISSLTRKAFTRSFGIAAPMQLFSFRNSCAFQKFHCVTTLEPKSKLYVRYESSFKEKEQSSTPGLSNELDSTDPDAIYSKVKYEEKSLSEDTKAREGIASSPDHYSSLDENEQTETLSERIKNIYSNMFSKK